MLNFDIFEYMYFRTLFFIHLSFCTFFSDASSHLYDRLCPSVCHAFAETAKSIIILMKKYIIIIDFIIIIAVNIIIVIIVIVLIVIVVIIIKVVVVSLYEAKPY